MVRPSSGCRVDLNCPGFHGVAYQYRLVDVLCEDTSLFFTHYSNSNHNVESCTMVLYTYLLRKELVVCENTIFEVYLNQLSYAQVDKRKQLERERELFYT